MIKKEFTTWNSAYMQRESSATDVDPLENDISASYVSHPHRHMVKLYI